MVFPHGPSQGLAECSTSAKDKRVVLAQGFKVSLRSGLTHYVSRADQLEMRYVGAQPAA